MRGSQEERCVQMELAVYRCLSATSLLSSIPVLWSTLATQSAV